MCIRDRQYAVYLCHDDDAADEADEKQVAELELALPEGDYAVEWISTLTGQVVKSERLDHCNAVATLTSPPFTADVALRVTPR